MIISITLFNLEGFIILNDLMKYQKVITVLKLHIYINLLNNLEFNLLIITDSSNHSSSTDHTFYFFSTNSFVLLILN